MGVGGVKDAVGSPRYEKLGHVTQRNERFQKAMYCRNLCRFSGSLSQQTWVFYLKISPPPSPYAWNKSVLEFIFGRAVIQLIRTEEQCFLTATAWSTVFVSRSKFLRQRYIIHEVYQMSLTVSRRLSKIMTNWILSRSSTSLDLCTLMPTLSTTS